jgi:hypothetical protein
MQRCCWHMCALRREQDAHMHRCCQRYKAQGAAHSEDGGRYTHVPHTRSPCYPQQAVHVNDKLTLIATGIAVRMLDVAAV